MSQTRNAKYWIDKKANRKTGYPLATIAYYGPDDQFASKVAVGILLTENDDDVNDMKRWFSDRLDVRNDPVINNQILEFIESYQVQRVATMGRIIGCPHEEGIDYPTGEKCPQCSYWKNRDRWTGEVIA